MAATGQNLFFMRRETKTLIVDDSLSFLRVMEKMLLYLGIPDVTKADNGRRALELFECALLRGAPYSLVFLDIVMPGIDGQETLERMRAMEKEAGITGGEKSVIIMATSLHSPGDMMNAMFAGDCTDYLVKPFNIEDLGALLNKYTCLPGLSYQQEDFR